MVGQYTVIVTDTAEKPVKDALVTLLAGEDGEKDAFTVLLPDGRLLDGNDQTVVTVLLPTAKPATGLNVEVSDEQRNHAARDTDKKGQITVPDASGSAGEIIGTDTGDEDKSNTVNVDVTDQDGKPVDGAEIGVDKDGAVSVTLPDDFTFDEDGPVTVTITDNQGEAKPGVSVTVEDGDGTTAAGETGKEGKVTLPAAYHFAYLVGYRDGTIGPNRNMTRGEAAAVFARVLSEARGDELEGLRRSRFPDVRRDAWYADYVAYLEKLGKDVKITPCENTAAAAEAVAQSDRKDVAAIASHSCVALYGLERLAADIQDRSNNYTRFICISKKLEIYPGADKTSLMVVLPHRPGSLYQILARFYALGLNLIKLESRPLPDREFEFMFYFDLETSVYSPQFRQLMGELPGLCEEFSYLGSYQEVV